MASAAYDRRPTIPPPHRALNGSKGRDQRPALDKMLKAAVRKEFDVLAAWSVDRLGRSLAACTIW